MRRMDFLYAYFCGNALARWSFARPFGNALSCRGSVDVQGLGIYSRAAGLAGLFFGIALAIMGARYSLGESAAIVSAVFITSAFFVLGSIYVLVRRKSAE
jgi:hypothetical protein